MVGSPRAWRRPAGCQALGEQPRRRARISLTEADLPEVVVYLGNGQQMLNSFVSSELIIAGLLQQGKALFEQFAGARVVLLQGQLVTQRSGGQGCVYLVPRLAKQWQALFHERVPPGRVSAGDKREAGPG